MEFPCCLMTPLMVGKSLKMIRGSKSCQRLVLQGGSILLEVHVLEEDIQEDRNARGISPVSLEASADGKLSHDIDTVSKVSSAGIKGTRSVDVGEDGVTGLKERQGGEHRADLWSFVR